MQIALALRSLSVTIDNAGAEKTPILEESLALLLAHGNDLQTSIAFMWLAECEFCFGDGRKASDYARSALRFAEDSGSACMLAQMATNLAQYISGGSDHAATRRAAEAALRAATELGMDDQVTWAVQAIATAIAHSGDDETAARLVGFCDSRTGTLHSQRQVDFAEDIFYRRLLALLGERMGERALATAMSNGAAWTESDALKVALGPRPAAAA